jgi:hypothetical protein
VWIHLIVNGGAYWQWAHLGKIHVQRHKRMLDERQLNCCYTPGNCNTTYQVQIKSRLPCARVGFPQSHATTSKDRATWSKSWVYSSILPVRPRGHQCRSRQVTRTSSPFQPVSHKESDLIFTSFKRTLNKPMMTTETRVLKDRLACNSSTIALARPPSLFQSTPQAISLSGSTTACTWDGVLPRPKLN